MLQRIRIQNYKSLQDVTLDLQQVNLFIGPNNSGKSNVLKAITALGTDSPLIPFKKKYDKIELELDYQFPIKPLQISFEGNAKYLYTARLLKTLVVKENGYDQGRVGQLETHIYFTEEPDGNFIEYKGAHSFLEDVYAHIKVPIFKLDPAVVEFPYEYKREDTLSSNGNNLLPFIQNLYSESPFEFEKLEKEFAEITGDFLRIRLPAVENRMMQLLLFDKTGIGYTLDEVSEGVICFLILLCIVHQPNPPKLLLLEEPEKGIHPRRIKEVINFIFRLAEEKGVQVIMTSHSPIVLDEFADIPESVFIFDKNEEGATQIKNLQRDVIEPEQKRREELGLEPVDYLDALGESWKIGFLGGVPK